MDAKGQMLYGMHRVPAEFNSTNVIVCFCLVLCFNLLKTTGFSFNNCPEKGQFDRSLFIRRFLQLFIIQL